MSRRKMIALDEDDLAVISAHVQDAHVRVGDILWMRDHNRLVIGMRRPDIDLALSGEMEPSIVLSALRFDRVLACQSRDLDVADPDAMLRVLGIEFNINARPSGSAILLFAGGGMLRFDVECLECELADLGAAEAAVDLSADPAS